MSDEALACRELATFLTGTEARELATRLGAGQVMSAAVSVVGQARRHRVKALLRAAGLGQDKRDVTLSVLRAIEGAHAHQGSVSAVWTAPGALAQSGQLTSMLHHYVDAARESVICSTYNFQRSSALWEALRGVSARSEVEVRIYLDTAAADHHPATWKPSTAEVADRMRGARVFRTITHEGRLITSHAKFVAIDHQVLVVTSANFSASAEQRNVELGLVVEDPVLTQAVERDLARFEPHLYERVWSATA